MLLLVLGLANVDLESFARLRRSLRERVQRLPLADGRSTECD